jgi:hypothetical protein
LPKLHIFKVSLSLTAPKVISKLNQVFRFWLDLT